MGQPLPGKYPHILVLDLLLELLLLMLHDHAFESLDLFVVGCHVRGILGFALLGQGVVLDEAVGAHVHHLGVHLVRILKGLVDGGGHQLGLLEARALPYQRQTCCVEIVLLLNHGLGESLVLIRNLLLIDDFRISLGRRKLGISHKALVYLVHEPLVSVSIRLVQRAIDLSFVLFRLHEAIASGSPSLSLDVFKRWHVGHRKLLMVRRAFEGFRIIGEVVAALPPWARFLNRECILVNSVAIAGALYRVRPLRRVLPHTRLPLILAVHEVGLELLKCLFWDVYLILGLPDLIILLQLLNQLTMVERKRCLLSRRHCIRSGLIQGLHLRGLHIATEGFPDLLLQQIILVLNALFNMLLLHVLEVPFVGIAVNVTIEVQSNFEAILIIKPINLRNDVVIL